ncbi:IS3 family transposase [Mycoplasma sp. 480]|uniref:IS3 family transposase n=2 Tax=Mycoplasma sp. 480 TaxID=3440155 RepID=UPI003F51172E
MSKQLKPEEWKYWIKKYLANCEKMRNLDLFWTQYFHFRKTEPTNFKKMFFKEKVKLYNLGMNLESQTGKSPKKNKGVGRKRKILTPEEEKKIWDSIPREILIKSIKIYQDVLPKEVFDEIFNRVVKEHEEEQKKEKKEARNFRKFLFTMKISKSTFYRNKNKNVEAKELNQEEKLIYEGFTENNCLYGRKRLEVFIEKKHKIKINYRKIGRIMNKLNLFCIVRKKSKRREDKNTSVKFENIINRDFQGKNNNIFATDVSYIISPKDVFDSNHVYFSATIHHKTKKIVSWNLSRNNDLNLVIEHNKDLSFNEKWIMHTDHGSVYSSNKFVEIIEKNNGIISMSRVGNSLDNREIEYFFSNIKSECLSHIKIKNLTFNNLKEMINNYINWYNEERPQSILNWKTPNEIWNSWISK